MTSKTQSHQAAIRLGSNSDGMTFIRNSLAPIFARPEKKRGSLFEDFVSRLLEDQGCEVYRSGNFETDRAVQFRGQFFKVECRFKSRGKLSASEIRDFIERVRAGPATHVGMLVTNSLVPTTAEGYLVRATPHQVLIMDGNDINGLLSGLDNFERFLGRKNVAAAGGIPIKIHRREVPRVGVTLHHTINYQKSPSLWVEGRKVNYIANEADGPECLIYTPIWYRGSGRNYVLEAILEPLEKISDLERIFEKFDQIFSASPEAAFTLSQRKWSWHGFGAKCFLNCVKDQRLRYRNVGLIDYHHSETALYVDEVRMGGGRDCLFWFAAQPSTGSKIIHHPSCGFMFSGLPFETQRFHEFFTAIGSTPDGYDTWEDNRTKYYAPIDKPDLTPSGFVLNPKNSEVLVQGLVIRGTEVSGFRRDSESFKSEKSLDWIGEGLSQSESWIAEVLDWHELNHEPRPQYKIRTIRGLEIPAPGFGGAIVNIAVRSIFDSSGSRLENDSTLG